MSGGDFFSLHRGFGHFSCYNRKAKKMKQNIVFLWLVLAAVPLLKAQAGADTTGDESRRLPLIVNVHFQNLALPFSDPGSHFTHPGLSVGSELPLNKARTLYQQVHLGGSLNRELGNSFFLHTQFTYRHRILMVCFAEARAGLGWQRIYHPVQAYRLESGEWKKTPGGRSQVIVPFALSVGYAGRPGNTSLLQPFAGYQVVPALFYNAVIPLNFYSMFHLGVRVRL